MAQPCADLLDHTVRAASSDRDGIETQIGHRQNDDSGLFALGGVVADGRFDVFFKQGPIGEAGDRVIRREESQLIVAHLAFGQVLTTTSASEQCAVRVQHGIARQRKETFFAVGCPVAEVEAEGPPFAGQTGEGTFDAHLVVLSGADSKLVHFKFARVQEPEHPECRGRCFVDVDLKVDPPRTELRGSLSDRELFFAISQQGVLAC